MVLQVLKVDTGTQGEMNLSLSDGTSWHGRSALLPALPALPTPSLNVCSWCLVLD